ncbi:hypothetical protein CerSpe_257000 [Prunus speciosa]
MASYSNGDLVPVENNREVRRDLAIKSHAAAPKYGSNERQNLMAEIHEYLLSKSPVPEPSPSPVTSQASNRTSSGRVVNISGITLNVNNSKWVGVFDFFKEAPNPMRITKRFLVFMSFVSTSCSLVIL